MSRRPVLGLAAVACAALLVTACNPAAKKDEPGAGGAGGGFSKDLSGTLKTSGFNPSDEVGKSRGDLATSKVAPVTVTMDTTNFDAQKFAAQAQAGDVPDLIQLDRAGIGSLADKGLIKPLDECYSTWGVKTDRYYKAAIDDVTYDGSVYGIPQFFQSSLIIGNKRVMDAAGVTAADLDTSKPDVILEAARRMYAESGGNPSVLGFDGDIPGSTTTWLAVFGGRMVDDKGKPTLDDPNNIKAVEWMKQLADAQGGYARMKSFKDTMDVFGDKNQYVADQVGAQTWAQWYINVLSNTKDKVSIVGVPVKDLKGQVIGAAGGSAFAIPAASKNPAAACAWAINATSPEAWEAAGAARAETVKQKNSINTGLFTGSPEADKAIRDKFVKDSGNADFDQVIKTSYEGLDHTVSAGGSPVGGQAMDSLKNAVTVALSGEKTPEQALKDAQADAIRAWQQSNLGKKS